MAFRFSDIFPNYNHVQWSCRFPPGRSFFILANQERRICIALKSDGRNSSMISRWSTTLVSLIPVPIPSSTPQMKVQEIKDPSFFRCHLVPPLKIPHFNIINLIRISQYWNFLLGDEALRVETWCCIFLLVSSEHPPLTFSLFFLYLPRGTGWFFFDIRKKQRSGILPMGTRVSRRSAVLAVTSTASLTFSGWKWHLWHSPSQSNVFTPVGALSPSPEQTAAVKTAPQVFCFVFHTVDNLL